MPRAVFLFACVLLLPWPAGAQGLGDAAAREKERRSREAQAGKKAEPATYTNDDLPNQAPAKKQDGQQPPAAGQAPAPEPSSPGPLAQRAAAEQEYQDKVDAAQKEVDALDARLKRLQASLNPMSPTYIYGGTGGATANDEMRVRNEMRDTETQLAAARQALETAKNELSEFRLGRRPVSPSTAGPPVG
ncbi:MAG TPA: hypothetical protein VMX54_15580 [Vicinamibacteria bacterium]|nr:hypothetical protein [Vicinamibacteria bacterium]